MGMGPWLSSVSARSQKYLPSMDSLSLPNVIVAISGIYNLPCCPLMGACSYQSSCLWRTTCDPWTAFYYHSHYFYAVMLRHVWGLNSILMDLLVSESPSHLSPVKALYDNRITWGWWERNALVTQNRVKLPSWSENRLVSCLLVRVWTPVPEKCVSHILSSCNTRVIGLFPAHALVSCLQWWNVAK